ncbi:MAG: glycosyltransferase, partial [Spirochaetaceae bacterium]
KIRPEKIRVITNGIDFEKTEKLCRDTIEEGDVFRNPGAFRIISGGRLTPQKNFQLLINAFARLPDNSGAQLAIIGYGEEMEALASLAEKLGVADRVSLPGYRENPWKYIAASDVFVLSSTFEGYPNVLLEAMATGVPVVSSDCPHGPRELIINGKNGILVPVNDESSLLKAMQRIREDRSLGKKLGDSGKETARNLDLQKMVKQYESLF